jgi:hypothetical protein
MTASMQYDLVPGRVVARVFAHQLAARQPVACFSYVTDGLLGFGQRELVFTLVRDPDAQLQQAPHEPLQLLQTIAGLAQQGRIVEAGGLTELGPNGVFGRPSLRGFVYQVAWPMEGVTMAPGTLAMVAIHADELDTVKRLGALRVLARLGRMHNFWPTAPWCDPDRGPSASAAPSVLDNVAAAHIPGVSVVYEPGGRRVVVRLARTAQAAIQQAGLPPPEAALAILTVLDPGVDACLVWFPGQNGPEAISAPGSNGTRIAGCFIAFVPQQDHDGANPFEDGLAAMLTDASWARVRQALVAGMPLEIPGNCALAIEWYDEAVPRVEVPPVSEMQMHLRESQGDIEARVGMAALVAYANAIEQTVQQHYANQRGHGSTLMIEVVLAQGRTPAIHGQLEPALLSRLRSVPGPAVSSGEIAFRGVFELFGGAS